MQIIARVKYLQYREATASATALVRPDWIKIEDWIITPDGTRKRTKVGGFVRKRETALAFAELLKAVADKLARIEYDARQVLLSEDELGLPHPVLDSNWTGELPRLPLKHKKGK